MADFGTAKTIDDSELSNMSKQLRRTRSQPIHVMAEQFTAGEEDEGLVGSEDYISPEALAGDRKVLNQGNDLWSLGVILWQMFSRERVTPFAGATQDKTF